MTNPARIDFPPPSARVPIKKICRFMGAKGKRRKKEKERGEKKEGRRGKRERKKSIISL